MRKTTTALLGAGLLAASMLVIGAYAASAGSLHCVFGCETESSDLGGTRTDDRGRARAERDLRFSHPELIFTCVGDRCAEQVTVTARNGPVVIRGIEFK